MSERKPVTDTIELGGQVLRLELAEPPRNVLDGTALDAISSALARAAAAADAHHLKAILLTAAGPNYSVGASVPEHTREEAPRMLARFHGAIRALLAANLPIVAAVRGHCLGGGLEVVLPATRLFATKDAKLGQPEVRLAAFAPVASLLLSRRVGGARAEELLLTGRVVLADEALRIGLVDELVEGDPAEAALTWVKTNLGELSAQAIRIATRAARTSFAIDFERHLRELERLYVEELLPSHDADEGVRAFMAKRPARWEDR